jgi:hypothetical protein
MVCADEIDIVHYVTSCDLAVDITDLLGLLLQKFVRALQPLKTQST